MRTLTLIDGGSVCVKSSDLCLLESLILEAQRLATEQELARTPQELAQATFELSLKSGGLHYKAAGVDDWPRPMDRRPHPVRSVGYFIAGTYYARHPAASPEQRQIFTSTARFFREAFIVAAASRLAQREPRDPDYAAKLRAAQGRIERPYVDEFSRQTYAFEELVTGLANRN